ncbi:unnamed protein product [Hermetia illucens]|uniref:Large ribosomal subunit protein mL50 n=1 Tax=Hermetia illucens TaxID=343691 RepID=A0A7R8UJG1_HERIL|nr:39S ribosomal protein L50, mitochondrial [Hermetia illucens]CAD7081995.1 unnamed protein product [Hermetia illucens]
MAALAQVTFRSVIHRISTKNVTKGVTRPVSTSPVHNSNKHQYKTPPNRFKKATAVASAATTAGRRIDSVAASLASKGFLRSQNPYEPPENVASQVKEIFNQHQVPADGKVELSSLEKKYAILKACSCNFNHSVPNSQIHEMKTFDNIVQFYETPVAITTPLEALREAQLPENLHIQHDYVRFHPETDTMFGGKTAFPKSSTLVTGLKYRNKYPGHVAKQSWP